MNEFVDARVQSDEQLDVLANSTRRDILIALLDRPPHRESPIDVSELVDQTNMPEMAIEMHHNHLPKLEARGFIRWDRDADRVSRGPQFGEIKPLLTLLDDNRDKLPDGWL